MFNPLALGCELKIPKVTTVVQCKNLFFALKSLIRLIPLKRKAIPLDLCISFQNWENHQKYKKNNTFFTTCYNFLDNVKAAVLVTYND